MENNLYIKSSTKKLARWIISMSFFVLCLFTVNVNAQVATNSGSGLAATYPSLAAAITALNGATITSPVVITLTGNETAPVGTGYYITATGTSTNTIIIEGVTSTITASDNSATAGGVLDAPFKIVGGDYITIRNFTIQENASNTVTTVGATNTMTEAGVLLIHASATDGAQNNTIQNNIISLSSAYTNSIGIFSTSASTTTNASPGGNASGDATSTAGTNSNNKIYGNTISNVAQGIVFICPPITATIFETGNDIGGASGATANTVTFGNATASSGPWNRSQTTVQGGIYYRNGAGNNISFNSVTSNSAAYVGSGGVNGIMISSGAAPTGVTYTSTISNNTVNITTTGVALITGIDFGHGISTGTIVGSSNNVTVNQTATAANAAAAIGIKANYSSAANTCSSNTIVINQSETTGALSSATTGLTLSGTSAGVITANSNNITVNQTGSGTGTITGAIVALSVGASTTTNILTNTILVNQTTSVATGISTPISGIVATSAASVALNITTNNAITIKQAVTGAGTWGGGAIAYASINAAHGIANVTSNSFNTTGSTIRSTGSLDVVLGGGTTTVGLVNVKSNTANIDRVSASGAVGFYTQTSTAPNDPADTLSSNNITFTGLAGTTTVTVINRLGGSTSATRNICNNTISVTGANTGATVGIAHSFSTLSRVSENSVTINNAATSVTGITSTSSATNTTVIFNNLSLTSSTTAPTAMTGISILATSGTNSISDNIFTLMTLTGVITGSPTITALVAAGGAPETVARNTFTSLSFGAASSTASPTIIGISVTGGTTNNVTSNYITNISTGATSGNATVVGLALSGGTTNNVSKNKIADIGTSATGATSLVSGLRISGGTTNNVFNNYIGNLSAGSVPSLDAIRGINITATNTATQRIYFNTVYLSATGPATFGTTGIFHTVSATAGTSSLDLRNNIIVNNSTPGTTGLTVAYRRSGTNIENYATTSDRNLFYAGTAGASNLIYADGTNNIQTYAAYAALTTPAISAALAPRDANSFVETVSGTPGVFFQSFTSTSSTYLHAVSGLTSLIESGASTISTPAITDDYDGDVRCPGGGCPGSSATPDVGADEFAGTSPKPVITLVSVTPAGNQCTATARDIVLSVTTSSPNTITSVTISGNNGAPFGPISMVNSPINSPTWTYTIPAASPTNATVSWTATATNSISLTSTYVGATYQDEASTVQASNITSTGGAFALPISWTNGNGSGRVVLMNTSNSFTNPSDGSNPSASSVWANAGQQVVFNGTGNTVTVTNLSPSTTYWFRVYEFSCVSRLYTTTTATNNPRSFTTDAYLAFNVTRATAQTYTSIFPSSIQQGGNGTGVAYTYSTFSNDEALSTVVSIPSSTFQYQGSTVTGFNVNVNGVACLRNAASPVIGGTDWNNSLVTITGRNILAAFYEDLTLNPATDGQANLDLHMRYNIGAGTPGTRKITMEWRHMTFFGKQGPEIYFQIVLDEVGNKIYYNYGDMQLYNGTQDIRPSYTIGMSGALVANPPIAGQLFVQQYENTTAFGITDAIAQSVGANGLAISPEPHSTLTFDPSVTYTYPGAVAPNTDPPGNDESFAPVTIQALTAFPTNIAWNYTTNESNLFTTRYATHSSEAVCGGSATGKDVWFVFNANNPDATVRIYGSGGYIPRLEVLKDDLTPLPSPQCILGSQGLTASANLSGLSPGSDYYVRVYHNQTGVTATATANVSGGVVTSYTMTNTGTSYTASPSLFGYTNNNLTARVRVSGGGGNNAEGTPTMTGGSITSIAVSTNGAGTGYTSAPTVSIESPDWGITGEFGIIVFAKAVNDECAGAYNLTGLNNATCVNGQNSRDGEVTSAATISTAEGTPSCATAGDNDDDVWFKFTAVYSKTLVSINGHGTLNPAFQVWDGGVSGNCATKVSNSVDCYNASAGLTESATVNTIAGRVYFVRVWHVGAGSGGPGSSFDICVSSHIPDCIAAPTSPVNGGNACSTGGTLAWPVSADATGYLVYSTTGGVTTLLATNTPNTNNTLNIPGPIPTGAYTWKVVPFNTIGEASGCATWTINVVDPPTVTITPNPGSARFCAGQGGNVQLTASGATTYTWSPATGLNQTTGAVVIATPTSTTSYTVNGTVAAGCAGVQVILVTVDPVPGNPTASGYQICTNGSIPPGEGLIAQCPASGSVTVNFNIPSQPTETNSAPGISISTGTMAAIPMGATISSATLTYNGLTAIGNSWEADIRLGLSGAVTDAAAVGTGAINGAGTFNYTRSIPSGSINTAGGSVDLMYWDNVSDNTGDEAIFPTGTSVASLVINYTVAASNLGWYDPSNTLLGSTSPFDPIGTSAYLPNSSTPGTYTFTARCSNDFCQSSGTPVTLVIGNTALTVTASPSPAAHCAGSSDQLNVSVAGGGQPYSYSWAPTAGLSNPTIANPVATAATTTTYTVTVSDACAQSSTATVTITVNPNPTVAVSPTSASYCATNPVPTVLTASGADTYTWSPTTAMSPSTGGAVVTVTPTTTTSYTVTGTTTATGCFAKAVSTITVGQAFAAGATASPTGVCPGGTSQLNATPTDNPANAILISEVTLFKAGTGSTPVYPPYASAGLDFVEISNISNATVDISGYTFDDYLDYYYYDPTISNHPFTFPSGTTIPAHSALVVSMGTGTDDVANRYYNTGGPTGTYLDGDLMGVVLKNGATIVDAVATNGFVFDPSLGVSAANWSGSAISNFGSAGTRRTSATDTNTGADWTESSATNVQDIGTYHIASGSFTYSWSPSGSLNNSTISNPIATVTTTTTYTVTVTNLIGGCSSTATVTVTADPLSAVNISLVNAYNATNYTFASASTGGSPLALSAPTQLLGTSIDDNPSTVNGIGFSFVYEGSTYTSFSINSNELMKLGPVVITGELTNDFLSGTNVPKFMPAWNDNETGTDGGVFYEIQGSPGSQKLIVEWRYIIGFADAPTTNTCQVVLYEGSNVIEFRYGAGVDGGTHSVGIGGASAANFISLTTTLGGASSSTSTPNNLNAIYPGSGTLYTFTPPAVINQVCLGSSKTMLATPVGGGQPYQYSWSPAAGLNATTGNSVIATPTTTTTYSVTVKDFCNQTKSSSFQIVVNPLPTVSVSAVGSTTICNPGSVTLQASGAVSYVWAPSAGLDNVNTSSVVASPTGNTTYTVTGTSASGCTGTATITVTAAPPLYAFPYADQAVGCDPFSTTLHAGQVNNANGNFTVSSTPYVAQDISGFTAATLTDDGNAGPFALPFSFSFYGTAYSNVYINSNGGISFNAAAMALTSQSLPDPAVQNNLIALCWADLNAGVGGTVSYGTVGTAPNRIFVVDYAGVPFYLFPSGTGSVSGQIWLHEASNIVEIHVSTVDHGTSTSLNVMGVENADGSLGTAAPGRQRGTAWDVSTPEAYVFRPANASLPGYSWSPAGLLNNSSIENPVATVPLGNTTFTVTVTNALGCTATGTVTITSNPSPPAPTVTPSGPTSFCIGGSVTLTAQPNPNHLSYSWAPAAGLDVTTGATVVASPTVTTNYTVYAYGANGCPGVTVVTVTVNTPNVAISWPGAPNPAALTFCQGGSVALTASGGTSYTWAPGAGLSATTGANVTATASGTYTVTATNGFGCTASTSVTVTVNPNPTVSIVAGGPTTICNDNTGSVLLDATATGSGLTYQWNNFPPEATTEDYTVTGDDITFFASGNPYYDFGVTVTNSFGCTATSNLITVTTVPCGGVVLNMRMVIQGFYDPATDLMDVGHPGEGCLYYLTNAIPWTNSDPYYTTDPNDVDDLTITAIDATTYLDVESKVGRLKLNGDVSVTFTGPAVAGTSYFLRLNHRNLVATYSKSAIPFTAITTYDFTTGSNKAYDDGFNLPTKQVDASPVVWASYNGDIDQDGGVTSLDMTMEENDANVAAFGYNDSDLDGDGSSGSLDMTLIENNSNANIYAPPFP